MKGQGVFATKPIYEGEFVCIYEGDNITPTEAERRIALYEKVSL